MIFVIVFINIKFNQLIINSRTTTTIKSSFAKFVEFSMKWRTNIIRFRKTNQKFKEYIVVYRNSSTFRNFKNSFSFSESQFFTKQRRTINFNSIIFFVFTQSRKNRRNINVSKQKRFFDFFNSTNFVAFNQKSILISNFFSFNRNQSSIENKRRRHNIVFNVIDIIAKKIIYNRSIDLESKSNSKFETFDFVKD